MQRAHALTSGIVLAGTFAWSNSTFDRLAPRPLVPVAHRPLISFSLVWLQQAGIKSIAVCANRNSRGVQTTLLRHSSDDLDLSYFEDAMPRGAAGCMRDAAVASDSQTFVVLDGCMVPELDLDDLLRTHHASGAIATVVVSPERRRGEGSPLQVPAGIYVFERRAIDMVSRHGFVDIKEHLIPRLVKAGERIVPYIFRADMPRVLNTETYLATHEHVTQVIAASRSGLFLPAGYEVRGEALVHAEASIGPDVILTGPVLVAAGATILPRAVIVGPTSIGCDVTIGVGAVVSRSAVWRRARIFANAIVDRSIVADDGVVERGREAYRTVVAPDDVNGSPRVLRRSTTSAQPAALGRQPSTEPAASGA